ncbi:MAG: GMC family oxidoreductase N-terminal domain-containing protein, partial [Acidiferrobacterales bacterium]
MTAHRKQAVEYLTISRASRICHTNVGLLRHHQPDTRCSSSVSAVSLAAKASLHPMRQKLDKTTPVLDEFDYIVAGAGSAGCVVAARLSKDPDLRVLLLEAGPEDDSWTIRMPGALRLNFLGGRYNWAFHTEAEPHLGGRRLYQPRGRGLGGSSSINGMTYVRGHALVYERWVTEGATGWSYGEVLPYFKRIESHEDGEDPWHGDAGPVRIARMSALHPINEAFLEAGEQAGYARGNDLNGY